MSRKSGKGIDKRRRYMSYADKVFIDMCRDIIDNGTSTEGEKRASGLGRRNVCIYDQTIRRCEPI